jgi:hypothetical protein
MNNDEDSALAPESRHPVCHACGRAVDFEGDNALVETFADPDSPDMNRIAWHQDCLNDFLDQGETT